MLAAFDLGSDAIYGLLYIVHGALCMQVVALLILYMFLKSLGLGLI